MTSHTQGRLLESPTDVYSHISHKLSEDGLNPECTDQEKLLFLWKLHQHQEDDLQKARETENKLKEAQAEEMKEVESYVEHIRHLSDEREALIQDLESENETLKSQIVALEKGDNDAAQAEIIEMLTQQGLAEISDATQSEQIAFLLVERARLLDELEEQHNNNSNNNSNTNTPSADGRSSEMELKQILEQERGDFEESLNQHRESAKIFGEQLKQEHEEEINALMEENSKLEEDLQRAEMQVSQLKAELSRYEGDDQNELNLSLNKSSTFSSDADRKKLKEERNQLNEEREEFEKEIYVFDTEKQQFDKDKQEFANQKSEFETVKSTFKKEQSKVNQMKSEMEVERKEVTLTKDRLEQDRKNFEKKQLDLQHRKDDLENEREEFVKEKEAWSKDNKDSPQSLAFRNQSPSRSSNDMALRKIIEEKTKIEGELMTIKTTLRSLQKEKDAHDDVVSKLKGDLEKCHVQHQQLQGKNRSLTHELQELEMQLDDAETSMDSITKEKQDLSEKYTSLNSEIKNLRADAKKSSTLQDIVDILNMDKKQLSESLESLKKVYEQTNTEKTELTNQNHRLSKEEQELTNQLRASKEEFQKMEKERDNLASEKSELLALKKKQEEVEHLLRADLDEMVKMKEKFANQTDILSKENKELLNKLEKTREDLEGARISLQELARQQLVIDHLKDQNQHLQDQISSSNDDLGSSKNRETMLLTAQQSLQKNYEDTEKRFSQDIDDLKMKLELTLQELAKAKKQVEVLAREKSHLTDTLSGKERILQDFSKVKHNLEEEQKNRNNLQLDINKLQNQLAEKSILADKFDLERKQRLDLESQISSLKDVENSLRVMSRELEKEKQMRESLEDHTESLEKSLTTRVSKEEFTSAQDTADKERQLRAELEMRVRDLEHDLKETEICSLSATERLENEQGLRQSLEVNVKDLQAALNDQGTAEELMRLREELNRERAALRELTDSKDDVELLCEELEKERSLRAELTRKIAQLETANGETATSTLKATLDELDRERRARMECDMRLQEAEQLLEDQRMDSDNLHHSMSSKMMSLEKRIQSLQDDLFTAQDELQAFQERYEQAIAEMESLKMENKRLEVQNSNMHQSQTSTHQTLMSSSSVTSLHSKPPWREEQMTQDSGMGSQHLQDTLNELNNVKSRLCRTEEELKDRGSDIDNSRQEVSLLKRSLEQTTAQLEESENDLRAIRQQLVNTQESLSQSKFRLEEKQAKLESVVQERDEIQRELDNLNDEYQLKVTPQVTPRPPDPAFYGEEERQEHVDRIRTLEKLSRQLELDNREMAMKLSDSISKRDGLEEQVQREKLKNTDRYQQSSRYTDQLEHDLDTANQHIRQLREEMQQHQTKSFKIEADNLGLAAKYESQISRLETENKEMKQRHRQELDTLSQRMEVSGTEARDLRVGKREQDQEVSQLRLEVSRLKGNKERLELLLQTETKQRQDLENRNAVIDTEMTKVWSQVRNLMEKNAELETSNRNQDQELTMKMTAMRQVESTLSQKESSFETSSKTLTTRAEIAEKKAKDLKRDVDDLSQKLLAVENQLVDSDSGKIQLEDTKDRLASLRNKMEGEKLQRTLLDQTVAELKHQVALLKQRESKLTVENKDFQHTILDLESKLEQFQENISLGYDNHSNHQQPMSEVGKRSLVDQITRLQHEVKDLQFELFSVSERRDVDSKRYEERKLRTKAKLMKARDFYTTERVKYSEHMKHLEDDLRLTRATLSKEVEWRDKMDDSYKQLLREKRDLITQLSEAEESSRDKARVLSMAQVKSKYMEEENGRLQDRVQNLTQQKQHLDKLLRDFGKREKTRVTSPVDHTVATSGLGNSLDSAWDPNDMGVSWSSAQLLDSGVKVRNNNNVSGYSGLDSGGEDDDHHHHLHHQQHQHHQQHHHHPMSSHGGKKTMHHSSNNNNNNNINSHNNYSHNSGGTTHVNIVNAGGGGGGSGGLPRATGAYTLYRDDNDNMDFEA